MDDLIIVLVHIELLRSRVNFIVDVVVWYTLNELNLLIQACWTVQSDLNCLYTGQNELDRDYPSKPKSLPLNLGWVSGDQTIRRSIYMLQDTGTT